MLLKRAEAVSTATCGASVQPLVKMLPKESPQSCGAGPAKITPVPCGIVDSPCVLLKRPEAVQPLVKMLPERFGGQHQGDRPPTNSSSECP